MVYPKGQSLEGNLREQVLVSMQFFWLLLWLFPHVCMLGMSPSLACSTPTLQAALREKSQLLSWRLSLKASSSSALQPVSELSMQFITVKSFTRPFHLWISFRITINDDLSLFMTPGQHLSSTTTVLLFLATEISSNSFTLSSYWYSTS